MNDSITNRQIAFTLLLTLTSFSVVDIARAMATSAGYGGWLTILVASLFFAIVATICVRLNNIFQGETIIEYSKKLIGKFGCYLIACFYFLYFLMIVIFLNISLANILKFEYLLKTPKAATLLVGIIVFCYIAYKGLITLMRLMEYIGMIYIILGSSILLIMLTQGNLSNVLPLFNTSDIKLYAMALTDAIFPFLGIEILLLLPLTAKNGKSVIPTVFISVLSVGLFYVLIVESCIIKLGINDIVHYNYSLIVAIRDMELPFLDFLKRLDVLFLTIGFAGFFMGISLVYTMLLDIFCKIFIKVKRGVVIIFIGVITFILSLNLGQVNEFGEFVLSIGKYIGLVAALLIPAILLIITKVKKNA